MRNPNRGETAMSERLTFLIFVLLLAAVGYLGFMAVKENLKQSNQIQNIRAENAERQMAE